MLFFALSVSLKLFVCAPSMIALCAGRFKGEMHTGKTNLHTIEMVRDKCWRHRLAGECVMVWNLVSVDLVLYRLLFSFSLPVSLARRNKNNSSSYKSNTIRGQRRACGRGRGRAVRTTTRGIN